VIKKPENQKTTLYLLQRQWLSVAAVFFLLSLLMYGLWRSGTASSYANQWLAQTAVIAAYCLGIVWRHMPENHRAGEKSVLPTFGWGNWLTIMRGLLMSMMAGFLFIPWPAGWLGWLPAILYTTADVADFLDGYAASKTNHTTLLGERLDMEFDGLGMLLVSLLAVWYGQLPWWYLLIGLARYFFVFGLWLRKKRGLSNHTMPHSWHRRIFAGFQMGFMSVVLWPIVPAAAATITGTIFALATAASFLRDWLVVIGWLDPQSAPYQTYQHRVYRLFSFYLPPVFRLIFAGCVFVLVERLETPWQPIGWVALFSSWHLPWPAFLATFFVVVGCAASILIALGILGRVMALVMVFPLGFDMVVNGANWFNGVAMACAIFIMLLSTGALSLWQPEEHYMFRRAGE
jgi:CDP-diacylglycerol--glycerol-3-phosphate 3-phosphatidyltransferase